MKTPQTKPADLNDLFRATDARARGRRVIRPLSRANKRNKSSNQTTIMSTPSPKAARSSSRYSVGMFSAGEARCDRWQDLAHAAAPARLATYADKHATKVVLMRERSRPKLGQ